MAMTNSVKLNVIKNFEFTLRDGQRVLLDQDEAEQIRDYLNKELPKVEPVSIKTYTEKLEDMDITTDSSYVHIEHKPVSIGFREIFKRKSDPVNGTEPRTYVYYKHPLGTYGFQIENHRTQPFTSLGKISDPESPIGGFLRAIPSNTNVDKLWFRKNGVQTNNQVIKALIDILEYEKYLKVDPQFTDRRRQVEYHRTEKWLEVGNNHGELLKAHMISSNHQ